MIPEHFLKEAEKRSYPKDIRLGMISLLSEMSERDVNELYEDLNKYCEFVKDNQGKYVFNRKNEPKDLLHRFWQRTSDACPVEATVVEEQEEEFHDWVMEQYDELSINNY